MGKKKYEITPRDRYNKDPVKPGPGDYTYIPPPPPPPPLPTINPSVPNPQIVNTISEPPTNFFSLKAGRIGDAEPYVFGRCVADGILIAADDSWYNVFVDILWSVGECQEIEGQMIDNVLTPPGNGKYSMENHLGTASQVASPILDALKGSYDALANKAHSVLELAEGWSLDKRVMMKGLKLYDPRTTTTVYSTNPALALARVIVDSGYTINYPSVIIAANYCDEIIGATSPQTVRWEIGGQLKDRRSASDWICLLYTSPSPRDRS